MKHFLFRVVPVASLAAVLAASVASLPVLAQDSGPVISVPELRQDFTTVQDAVDAIGDGEGTILLAPGTYRQCAVQTQGIVHFRSLQAGQAVFDGVECEGKAALVLRGGGASVEGIVFQNMHVADLNGSGIRLEQGDLTISDSFFRNSDEGILTGPDEASDIRIDRSTFSRLGRNDGGPSHSIYVGGYRSLTVTRSRFERGTGGHYIKSRAGQADIRDNTFDDTLGNASNYMIDLPAGATGTIADNLFIQGANKENYAAFIAIAAEGQEHPSTGLTITDNTARLAPGVSRTTAFIADWSGDRLSIARNALGAGLTPFERR